MIFGSALGLGALVMLVIGSILAIAGIALLIVEQYKSKSWYVWFLIALGGFMDFVALIMLAVALSYNAKTINPQKSSSKPKSKT